MAESVSIVEYFYLEIADRPGEAARLLGALRDDGVNLLALSGFPRGRRAQLDLVPADAAALRATARRERWRLTGPKKAFLIQGDDRVGVMKDVLDRLAAAKINVTATQAICAGGGRFGAILWVPPQAQRRAARALGAA